MEKTKHSASSEEITKLYTDTYRTRMPLYNDYVFHRIYGRDTDESRAALIGLLNVILERKDDPIRNLEIKNPIDIGNLIMDKDTTMDIKAETDSKEILSIEMQVGHLSGYRCRTLFYGGRLVNSSLQSGQSYDKMKKSIVVSIIQNKLFPKEIGDQGIKNLNFAKYFLSRCVKRWYTDLVKSIQTFVFFQRKLRWKQVQFLHGPATVREEYFHGTSLELGLQILRCETGALGR